MLLKPPPRIPTWLAREGSEQDRQDAATGHSRFGEAQSMAQVRAGSPPTDDLWSGGDHPSDGWRVAQ